MRTKPVNGLDHNSSNLSVQPSLKNGRILFNIKDDKMTDPIADYLTRLRNAIKANHRVIEIPASNLKKEITKVLFDKGFILNYKFEDVQNMQGTIKIALKYNPETKQSAITTLKRVST